MPNARVVITARAACAAGAEATAPLSAAGLEVVAAPRFGPLGEAELIQTLAGAAGVVASSDAYTERVFAATPGLRVVARAGVGFDSIDLEAATRHGVVVVTTPGRISETVADYALGLLLALARRIPEAAAALRQQGWAVTAPGVDVWGKCLGIVGLGAIGAAVARRAAGFSLRILGCDPALGPEEIRARGAEPVGLPELLSQADFVTLHAALTPASRGLLGAAELARMKPGALLINTARGGLIDSAALVAALARGQLGGVALDAFDTEPLPPEHPLRAAPRCLLTPHLAFNTAENALDMSRRAAASVAAWLGGQPLPEGVRVCNPEVLRG